MNTLKDRSNESGNILIYILGAIILLGLLVIMVKGSTTPGSGIDREELALKVAEVQQYGMELERAVTYILRDGYSETDIRFAHPNHSSLYGDITDNPGRQVFSSQGGGATWHDNDIGIQTQDEDWVFAGSNRVVDIGGNDTGNADSELIAFLPYVSLDFCLELNEKAGVDNPSGSPPQDNGSFNITTPYTGNFQSLAVIGNTSGDNASGHIEACLEANVNPPAGTYHYYRVLLTR